MAGIIIDSKAFTEDTIYQVPQTYVDEDGNAQPLSNRYQLTVYVDPNSMNCTMKINPSADPYSDESVLSMNPSCLTCYQRTIDDIGISIEVGTVYLILTKF